MKLYHLLPLAGLLMAGHCFSQIKEVPKKPVLAQPSAREESITTGTLPATQLLPVSTPATTDPRKLKLIKFHTVPQDLSKASLLDAFITVETGMSLQTFPVTSGYNKDKDTHWSCGLFDQNEKPITSFHDDSDNDEYEQGSVTGPLKMHVDNAAVFGSFANGGHVHINIAPNGNDTWGIVSFTLSLDFLSPKTSQKITWGSMTLSQDKRDVDLYFYYDGNNFVQRQ